MRYSARPPPRSLAARCRSAARSWAIRSCPVRRCGTPWPPRRWASWYASARRPGGRAEAICSGSPRSPRPGSSASTSACSPRCGTPTPRLVGAATVVVAGAALVEGGGHADAAGLGYALGALAGEAAFSLLAAPLLPRLGPVRVSAWTCALAVPMLLGSAVVAGEPRRWRVPLPGEVAALAYLGLVLTVLAFLAWYAGLARLGVERAGMCFGLMPVAALTATAVFDGRVPPVAQVAGVLLVGAGLSAGLMAKPRLEPGPALAPSLALAPGLALDGADRVGVGQGGLAQRPLGVEAVGSRGRDDGQ